MKRRVLSFITTLALCLNLCPSWAFAAVDVPDGTLCPHHPEHTAECGYVPETPDSPCTFVCRICPIEDLIDGLPDSVSEDNAEQVGEQLGEIFDLYDGLTAGEQEQVDLSSCTALMEQLEGLDTEVLIDDSTKEDTLTDNASERFPRVVTASVLFKTNGYTLTNTGADPDSTAIQVTGTGKLEIIGAGTIKSNLGIAVEVQSGGSLTIAEPGIILRGSTYALYIASGAKVQLSAGTYTSTNECPAIYVEGNDFASVLGENFAFFDADGNALPLSDLATVDTVTVGQHTDHVKGNCTAVPGTPTHTWTCAYCGKTEPEKCTFDFAQGGPETSTCAACGNGITIDVDETALSNLVYDGTLKPTDVPVTVTLTDGTVLTKDTDYTEDIDSIKDAGTATVTVTGITFNGTFVKTYTVEQDKPGLSWDSTDPIETIVDYDGQPVETGDLPAVNINIQSAVDDLREYLQYSHKKPDDADYTDGLPKDAGTYNVIVSLPELPNFEGAVSDPITLTINPIAPIAMAPAATTPTYNRAAQELVTAGTLKPVAIADGLKIQFATSENGTYSDTIPTGTNAGDYTVWYKVEVPADVTGNYNVPNPSEVTGVEILRKAITPVVTLSQYSYLYDGGDKEPAVTVKDDDRVTDLPDTEYTVEYVNNRNVSTGEAPAKVVVSDKTPNGGNYDITQVITPFKITLRTQETLSITQKPGTFVYGDQFTLSTTGGSGDGNVTWKIVPEDPDDPNAVAATVDAKSGQVTITGHGAVTVQATKSGEDPKTHVKNYEDAVATWTFTAVKRPVTATVTAEDKIFNGDNIATVHAVVESGVLAGDEITITGLTGAFDDENAGVDKTVTVVTTGATITGHNSEHYAVTYSATTVKATINKAIAKITDAPVPASLTYNGTAQALIDTAAVVDPNSVQVEYALSEDGPYDTSYPEGTNAGTYTVWYRIQETDNYTGLAPESVDVTIDKKPVNPTITLDETSFVYDGNAKEPGVTLNDENGNLIPIDEYTVDYSGNVNVGTATVTVTAKPEGNYQFDNAPVTANFTIGKQQAAVVESPEAAGLPLYYNTFAQKLVTEGEASGGTMVYCVDDEDGTYEAGIPTETDAAEYTVYYKVQGDDNHSDSAVGHVKVTIAPKTVKDPTIELFNADDTPLVSYTYDGTAKEPKVVVKDGSTVIDADKEYNVVYSDNTDAGHGTVNITDKPGGNYEVTGSKTFVINKADIVFNPAPSAAAITYDGKPHELLNPGTTTGGTVQYALGSATSTFTDAIPRGTNAGRYNVYYKVVGDKNHNDLAVKGPVAVTIGRKPLTAITIELTPDSFQYDGKAHLPTVAVKFTEGKTETVVPATEYDWACNVPSPTAAGQYTITVTDAANGNYDLSGANPNTATFTIGKAAQAELVINGKPAVTNYGDSFPLTAGGGSGGGAVTWKVDAGPATVDGSGNVTINGVGEVTITAEKAADTNYEAAQAQLTFTAAPKPVTASVTVDNKPFDGTTAATVTSANITTINSDTVTIDETSITAAFEDPHAGTGKTVTLDTSKVKVTGDDVAKYAISYPDEVTSNINQATTTINPAPAAIDNLTYSGQPQALVTAGETNVGFLVYSLSENGEYSREIPTGTDAGTYTVYYRVDGTADYTGVAVNETPISVTIGPKPITPKIELSEKSFLYDGTKKDPKVTLKDGDTVIPEDQYTVTWAGTKSQTDADMLRVADNYTATIVDTGKNYTFSVTAAVEIKPAEQAAITITGQPGHVYYGDTITTLGTTGGTGEGTVKWSVTEGNTIASIDATSGKLTISGVGAVAVRAERSVPNYGTVGDNWNFTVEPKPVVAEVTVASKTYDGTMAVADTAITAQVKTSDLVNAADSVSISGLTGAYTDPNAGTGKTVTLDSTGATVSGTDAAKYTVSYPATAKGNITAKPVTVTVTLTDHDLKSDANGQYYEYDGTEKKPDVTVTYGTPAETIPASNYETSYANNKNVGTNAAVTVTAKESGNYTFPDATVTFEIRKAAAVLTTTPQAKDLTYNGTAQELVTGGVAAGGTVKYSKTGADGSYSETIPQETNAGTYTVYYMVDGDANHNDTTPSQVSVTIKSKEITPAITLDTNSYEYDGTEKKPTVTVKDGNTVIDGPGTAKPEYTVSYRDNVNAGTATVTVSDANGGNYIVNGTANFTITKAAPEVTTEPTAKTGLYYTGETQDLVNAGVCGEGTVEYSVNGGNYSSAIPTASAVGTYTIAWRVKGDANHSDTDPDTLTVTIAKNTVTNPTITLSSDTFKYNGSQQKPEITVYDNNSRVIPTHEYTVSITPGKSTNTSNMVDVDTYTVTIAAAANSNYEFTGDVDRTFKIVPADQETISITGTKAQVRYGDEIKLGVSGGSGSGTVTWKITGSTATTLTQNGLLTVKDVNTAITVTVTRTRANYGDVSATWEFTAAKKPVTAVLTGVDKPFDGNATATVKAVVDAGDLVFGDTLTIPDLTGTFDNANVGTNKTITVTGTAPENDKYAITYPATTTASILGVAATVDTPPEAVPSLTYDASQAQELVTAGAATGGTMVYSLDGTNFTPNIPKGKDAGTYKVYYKAQGDQNHMDSAVGTKDVSIAQQSVTPQIELSPPSVQYDGNVKRPETVIVRDTDNNVIPDSEYTVVYDSGTNWTNVGKHKVKVQNITGGNYNITEAEAEFEISASAQNPLTIVNQPGLVYYGDTFTLSTSGGSGNGAVTWSSSNTAIADIDANGFVTIKGTGPATITAKKAGGDNYGDATATYPLNALKKPITAIVTADDKVYDGNTSATIHVTWRDGDLVVGDTIQFSPAPTGAFDDDAVGTNKQVTVTANVVNNATAQKYDITIPGTTTASITKATATAPSVTAVTGLVYDSTAKTLVSGGDANTRYSDAMNGVYSENVPQKTNAGTYTVWYKEKGDANHNESEPKSCTVTISPKTLTLAAANIELSGNDLQGNATDGYYYQYDGTEKKPAVTIKDGAATVPAREYTVGYTDNKNVTTDDKKATVTITDNEGGNYTVSGSTTFEIRKAAAVLTGTPKANDLTYTGMAQALVSVGTATGGHIEYAVDGGSFGKTIPTGTGAKTYTVTYKVVGDGNHEDGPTGSVTVTIQPKTVISPKITVTGTFTYDGTAKEPGAAVKVEDGTATIPATEYTLSYRDNVNAGTATVIVTDNNGGNYTVNGTATFEIGKKAATGTAPTGKTGLKYNGTAQELITAGSSNDGTVVYSLTQNGEYSAAIPTGKDVGEYEIWYMVQGDGNHSDSTPAKLADKVKIEKNTVTNPTVQVEPASVKYTGEKQTPTVTVLDDAGLLIDGSEYTVTYLDENSNSDLIQVGTYTVTVTGKDTNYSFSKTAAFTITPADQTPLTITGTRERVYYGDTIQLGATGGIDGGTVTWTVDNGNIADIDNTGLLTIKGVGQVTVTATSTASGYNPQTATWTLYANKKQVTAVVTADDKPYDGKTDAVLHVTWNAGDLVDGDSINVSDLSGAFTDPNVGTGKTVKITGTLTHANYDITVPPTATASISKAEVENVTAPTLASGLTYTGLPQELTTAAGNATGGTLEYSTDGVNYSAALPTGTDAKAYDVWYRVKGDGNHNDVAGAKIDGQVTIDPQTVTNPTIELTPGGASYDGQEHKPTVKVLDGNGREIPSTEYDVSYGTTDWKTVGKHTVTIADKTGGNYNLTGTLTQTFEILPAGQSPLSITGQPGEVQYGSVFTLSATGGSGTGAVTWESSDTTVAFVNSATGRVEILKAGPATITARKAAGGGYGETTATWTFSAERKPVTPIVTARNKPFDGNTTATLDVSWSSGDLLGNDTITLNLTGAFDDPNVGENKIVRISGTAPASDKYAVTIPRTTTASITATAATVSGSTPTTLTYSGTAQELVTNVTAQNGRLVYSENGTDFVDNSPTGRDAGRYQVWYKALGNTNYADSEVHSVYVTIQPKTVTNPVIELASDNVTYDGTAKEPEVLAVMDGSIEIPASEYTVRYSNNINVGTTARVTITDAPGGNYTVSGTKNFTIKAGTASLKEAPQPRDLTYNGKAQTLVMPGTAVNGKVVYSLDGGEYGAAIPRATDAGDYEVWYKVVDENGADATAPNLVEVTIDPKEVTPIIKLEGKSSYSVAYNSSAQEPEVSVYVESKLYDGLDIYYTVEYADNINAGTAEVTVQSIGGNYQFLAFKNFTITKGKAEFSSVPTAWQNLKYDGTAKNLVVAGTGKNGGTVVYSLDNAAYSTVIPTAINRGSYTVYAKVQGSSNCEESDVVTIPVEIGVNTLTANQLTVTLPTTNYPYTGGEVKPTVTVTDNTSGNVISADEYTVTYSNNINMGTNTAKVTVQSKQNGNYSFTAEATFSIIDASQVPLAITGKKEGTVYYGDTLSLGTTGGGSGTVTWSATGSVDRLGDGQYKVTSSGSVTITATKGSSTEAWTFYAQPKPVTATVTAANKVYNNGNTEATLTVTVSSGLVPGDSTITSVTATGHFDDGNAGTNKTVTITTFDVPTDVSAKYDISHPDTVTASITPAPAEVTAAPTLATGPLTYNGGAQALLARGGTAANGGNLMYSLDGLSYSYTIPTGTDAKTYTVWYKVVASDENHKDSAAVKLGDVIISANQDTPTVLCVPSTSQYNGTEQTPDVVVRDSQQRIIPESEYTVTFEDGRIATGKYDVTVTDKPGGNYEFSGDVTGTFEIVSAAQNPLSIVTDIPTDVHYGDTFRLSAMGGSGSGAIHWSIAESGVATINGNGVVTVTGTGGFTVTAYREAWGGYDKSNTDSVPFVANPKPVTPVVTASDKPYDGKTDAVLNARWNSGDLVNGDTITVTATGAFDAADAGTNKRVNITGHTATGANTDKYAITWPDSTTASIYKVDTKLDIAPAAADLTYDKTAQNLIAAGTGTTVDGIGTVEYAASQNGAYSTTIPTGTNAGKYTVWYKVADSVNYTGIAPAAITVEIKKATPTISTNPTASGTANQQLKDIQFANGGAASVDGKFAWAEPDTVAVAGTAYNVIFTPDDTANYNTVTIQVVAVSAAETSNAAPLRTTVRNGTANTVLSASGGNKLVQDAVKSQSDSIVIKPEITGDVTKASVSIPASTASRINSETNAALTVSAPIADVTIPNVALDTLGSAGGTVNVATEQVDGAVKLTLTAGGETVESVPGGVTLTVPAENATPGTVAVLVGEDGTRQVIQKSVAKNGAVSVPLDGSATVELVDNSRTFDDVSAEDWEADAVAFASAHELFNGTSETTFSPNQAMSRGMLTTVLYNLEGRPEQDLTTKDLETGYSDVNGDDWYADGVAWASEHGIVSGYGDGQFGPDDSITREQFAVMLWKYAGSPKASGQTLSFTDADQANSYAQEALCWAVEKGVMKGYNGQLSPGGTATRAEAAQMLKNFMEKT